MRRKYSLNKPWDSTKVEPPVRLWLLRLLVPMGVCKKSFSTGDKIDYRLGEYLFHSLAETFDTKKEWYTKSNNSINPEKVFNSLHKLYVAEEKKPRKSQSAQDIGF